MPDNRFHFALSPADASNLRKRAKQAKQTPQQFIAEALGYEAPAHGGRRGTVKPLAELTVAGLWRRLNTLSKRDAPAAEIAAVRDELAERGALKP